jgi:hypothetical protein
MPASAFGAYDFVQMSRRPAAPTQKIVLESRAGVAGNAAWSTGVRSDPQQIQTLRDVGTYSDAVTLCATYENLVGTVVSITYGGAVLGYTALVLAVEAQPEAVALGVGGIAGSSAALVRATWTIETRA